MATHPATPSPNRENNLSISLEKRTESAVISLTKVLQAEADKGNDLGELTANIILVNDYSYSMSDRYDGRVNEVQELGERVLAMSLSGLDDDGKVQVFFFDDKAYDPIEVTKSNYQGYVDRWRKPKFRPQRQFGGTDYLPAIDKIIAFATQKGMLAPGQPPVLVVFMTDGSTDNERKITERLYEAAKLPIFWQFMGLGYSPTFLKKLDKMTGRVVDNVGLFEIPGVLSLTDEEFYDKIIEEFFPSWLPAARAAGIVTV